MLRPFKGKQVQQHPDVLSKKFRNEAVLLNLNKGDYFTLNQTALFLWETCKIPKDLRQLTSELSEHFRIPRDQAEKDIESFLESLHKLGLIEIL